MALCIDIIDIVRYCCASAAFSWPFCKNKITGLNVGRRAQFILVAGWLSGGGVEDREDLAVSAPYRFSNPISKNTNQYPSKLIANHTFALLLFPASVVAALFLSLSLSLYLSPSRSN